jgi:hypothetical protein
MIDLIIEKTNSVMRPACLCLLRSTAAEVSGRSDKCHTRQQGAYAAVHSPGAYSGSQGGRPRQGDYSLHRGPELWFGCAKHGGVRWAGTPGLGRTVWAQEGQGRACWVGQGRTEAGRSAKAEQALQG